MVQLNLQPRSPSGQLRMLGNYEEFSARAAPHGGEDPLPHRRAAPQAREIPVLDHFS